MASTIPQCVEKHYMFLLFFHRKIQKPERNGQQTQKSFHISFFMRVFSFRFLSAERVSNYLSLAPFASSSALHVHIRIQSHMCVVPSKPANESSGVRSIRMCGMCVRAAGGNTQQLISSMVIFDGIDPNSFLWLCIQNAHRLRRFRYCHQTSERTIEEEENVFRFRFGNKIRKFRQVMVMAVNLFIAWILNAHPLWVCWPAVPSRRPETFPILRHFYYSPPPDMTWNDVRIENWSGEQQREKRQHFEVITWISRGATLRVNSESAVHLTSYQSSLLCTCV